MNSLAGIALAGYGAYLVYFGVSTESDVGPSLWLKAGLCILVGLGIAAYNSVDLIKGIMNKMKQDTVKNITVDSSTEEPVAGITILSEQEKDMEAVFYLTERCKKEGNGLELCRQLNDLFFSLHHPKDEVK